MDEELKFVVSRGEEIGVVLTPHRHQDGRYVASMSRYEEDYIRVESVRELLVFAKKGFSIRMSNPGSEKHRAPSLISPESLGIRFKDVL